MPELTRCDERDALLAAARDIAPALEACAAESERERRLPRSAVDAMLDARLFQCAAPRAVGGVEADPLTQIDVFEAVAAAEGSAGWNLMIGAILTGLIGAKATDAAAGAAFGAEAWPIAAGQIWPFGRVTTLGRGCAVTGHWRFASGIHHATWTLSGCHIFDGDAPRLDADGRPAWWFALVPVEAASIEDTWHVAGLRGTGSCDYRIDGHALGEAFLMKAAAPSAHRGGAWWRLPGPAHAMLGHAGFALGVARGSLDAVRALGDRRRYGSQSTQADRETVQLALGRLLAEYQAARLLVHDTVSGLWEAAERGETPSPARLLRQRVAAVLATEVAVRCAEFAFRTGGAAALFETSPLQRRLRDILAAQQHIAVADSAFVGYGRGALTTAERA